MANLRHVQRGQPLNIPADDWNRIVDATRAFYEQQGAGRGGPATAGMVRQSGVVLVKNASGQDQDRFAVLGIDGPIIPPGAEGNEDEFKRQVALSCVTPTAEHGASGGGRFVVLLEPLASGAIGRACVSGVTIVRLQVENEDDTIADVADGESAHLVSGTSGNAVILWKEEEGEGGDSGGGGRWAIVRIGGGGVLGVKVDPGTPVRPSYTLDHLLQTDYPLATAPRDRIVEARITAMTLSPVGSDASVLIKASKKGTPNDIYRKIERWLSDKHLPRESTRVLKVTFRLTFHHEGPGRTPTMTFAVGAPNSCDLKSWPDDKREIGERCLKLWKVTGDDDDE